MFQMKNSDKQVLKQAEERITELYNTVPHDNLVYHSIDHTKQVVERANEIAAHYDLSERDILVLNVAAWFHDAGHLYVDPTEHERKSVELMRLWCAETGESSGLADEAEPVIMATKLSTQPEGLIQEIIKDADTYHFGLPAFKKADKQMKKEMAMRNIGTMLMDWPGNTLALLETHRYFTSYCQDLLDEGKQKNMAKLKKKSETAAQNN
ncbi:MAG: HD domain-containing protein, partial [Chitinophagaceae bacterium]